MIANAQGGTALSVCAGCKPYCMGWRILEERNQACCSSLPIRSSRMPPEVASSPVNVVVDAAQTQGGNHSFYGGHDVGDAVVGEDFTFRGSRYDDQGGDSGGVPVENCVDGVHALGNFVGFCDGDTDDLVQVEVDVAEVRTHNVPTSGSACPRVQGRCDGVHQDASQSGTSPACCSRDSARQSDSTKRAYKDGETLASLLSR